MGPSFLNGTTSNKAIALAVSIAAAGWLLIKLRKTMKICVPHYPPAPLKGEQGEIIQVVGFPKRPENAVNPSPWVTRVVTYLRMSDIPHTYSAAGLQDAPRGLVPFIRHGKNLVPDSDLIIRYIQSTYPDSALQEPSDSFKRGVANAAACTAASLANILSRTFFLDEQGFAKVKEGFKDIPVPVRFFVQKLIRANVVKRVVSSGVASFTDEEVSYLTWSHFTTLSDIIGDNKFLVGDQPVPADALVFGILDSIVYAAEGLPIERLSREFPTLKKYVDNVRFMYFLQDS